MTAFSARIVARLAKTLNTLRVQAVVLSSVHAWQDAILDTDGRILVGFDFNDRVLEWACFSQTPGGKRILEMAARTGITI